jgi:DNA polymerase I-like protein with 3'-5' exonuclease and polymerase domains
MQNLQERIPGPLVLNPPPNIHRVKNFKDVDDLVQFLKSNKEFGFDVETNPVKDFYWRRIRTIQFGNAQIQYVIDLKDFCSDLFDAQGEYGKNLYKYQALDHLLFQLKPFLCSDEFLKVGVNLAFEYQCFYWSFGLRTYGYYDCMLAEKCIWAGMPGKASLKNYDFYSMEEMFLRYRNQQVDKTLQTSFNLDDPLTDEQYEYAALDTRIPMGIKTYQTFIATGETPVSLRKQGMKAIADALSYMPDLLFGDNLTEIIAIENAAIGSFVDMHVHGENIDVIRWTKRVQKAQVAFDELLKNLDKFFLPIVGSKLEAIDDKTIDELEIKWKGYNIETLEEKQCKLEISALKKQLRKVEETDNIQREYLQGLIDAHESTRAKLEAARKAEKEIYKKQCGDLKKKRTKIKRLAKDCEGEALINYGSDAQLLACLRDNVPRLAKLENLDDDILEEYSNIPVMKLIREYHGLSKDIGTYGMAWVSKWTTHPCKEEGWLHPGDGRLHCEFNQYDAETGRSSSSKPNGQNLPQDKEVRSSFIADPPDESIRISDCCEADTSQHGFNEDTGELTYWCSNCGLKCSTHPEEYVIITADMSGAELRIIAEDSGDDTWIEAFKRGDDLHSVGTELLYPDIWPGMTIKSKLKPEGWTLADCKTEVVLVIKDEDGKDKNIGPCAYFALKEDGTFAHKKCSCPGHNQYRNDTKACNFLLAYGGGPGTLAKNIKKTFKAAKQLMALHEQKNGPIWIYLDKSGKDSAMNQKAFDLFGRRRVLPEPTHEDAKENCKEYREKDLRLSDEERENNLNTFILLKGRKPDETEEWALTHREPTAKEIAQSYYQMVNGRGRQGKNMRIQGTNATIAKVAMSCLKDKNGIPYLWHTLPQYKARLVKFVHDELVVHAPKRYGKKVAELIGDAFKRAAATKMSKVIMEFDYAIASHWKK